MFTLPPDVLAARLRAQAQGAYGAEAAVELLIAHGIWLRRSDFNEQLVEHEIAHAFQLVAAPLHEPPRWQTRCWCGWESRWHDSRDEARDAANDHLDDPERDTYAQPDAQIDIWVHWAAIPQFAEHAPCSTTEANILRLAAELRDVDCGVPLGQLLTGLDDRNSRLVADAIDHVLTRGGRR
jgi:hypothetical protein